MLSHVAYLGLLSAGAYQAEIGPTTSTPPYLVPAAPGVRVISILTVGDFVNNKPDGTPYRLVGTPDGMAAWRDKSKRYVVLVNHEIDKTQGVVRAHGTAGAFVSKWIIDPATLAVALGEDLIQTVVPSSSAPMGRFCSGDLPQISAFFDFASRFGTWNRIYMNVEEIKPEGKAFAHVISGPNTGKSYSLPRLGRASWENALANPASGRRTVVGLLDDSSPGQVYIYIGSKQSRGSDIDRAGLTNGVLYGVRAGVPFEDRLTGVGTSGRFDLHAFGNVSSWSGANLQTASVAAGVTEFLRPEDGSWDPSNPRDFYFTTTDRFHTSLQDGNSRLWRLRFDDITRPELGGEITVLLDRFAPGAPNPYPQMMDNLTFDRNGNILIQEDAGSQGHLGRIWQYTLATGGLKVIAVHNSAFFQPGSPQFLTTDEESSGIIDATDILGRGWFLLASQAHYDHPDPELVTGGQLLAMYNPGSVPPGVPKK